MNFPGTILVCWERLVRNRDLALRPSSAFFSILLLLADFILFQNAGAGCFYSYNFMSILMYFFCGSCRSSTLILLALQFRMAASRRIMAEGFFFSSSPHSSIFSPSFLVAVSASHFPTSGSTLGVLSSSRVSSMLMGLANMPAGRCSSLEIILFLGVGCCCPEFLWFLGLTKLLPLDIRHYWSILNDFLSFQLQLYSHSSLTVSSTLINSSMPLFSLPCSCSSSSTIVLRHISDALMSLKYKLITYLICWLSTWSKILRNRSIISLALVYSLALGLVLQLPPLSPSPQPVKAVLQLSTSSSLSRWSLILRLSMFISTNSLKMYLNLDSSEFTCSMVWTKRVLFNLIQLTLRLSYLGTAYRVLSLTCSAWQTQAVFWPSPRSSSWQSSIRHFLSNIPFSMSSLQALICLQNLMISLSVLSTFISCLSSKSCVSSISRALSAGSKSMLIFLLMFLVHDQSLMAWKLGSLLRRSSRTDQTAQRNLRQLLGTFWGFLAFYCSSRGWQVLTIFLYLASWSFFCTWSWYWASASQFLALALIFLSVASTSSCSSSILLQFLLLTMECWSEYSRMLLARQQASMNLLSFASTNLISVLTAEMSMLSLSMESLYLSISSWRCFVSISWKMMSSQMSSLLVSAAIRDQNITWLVLKEFSSWYPSSLVNLQPLVRILYSLFSAESSWARRCELDCRSYEYIFLYCDSVWVLRVYLRLPFMKATNYWYRAYELYQPEFTTGIIMETLWVLQKCQFPKLVNEKHHQNY